MKDKINWNFLDDKKFEMKFDISGYDPNKVTIRFDDKHARIFYEYFWTEWESVNIKFPFNMVYLFEYANNRIIKDWVSPFSVLR